MPEDEEEWEDEEDEGAFAWLFFVCWFLLPCLPGLSSTVCWCPVWDDACIDAEARGSYQRCVLCEFVGTRGGSWLFRRTSTARTAADCRLLLCTGRVGAHSCSAVLPAHPAAAGDFTTVDLGMFGGPEDKQQRAAAPPRAAAAAAEPSSSARQQQEAAGEPLRGKPQQAAKQRQSGDDKEQARSQEDEEELAEMLAAFKRQMEQRRGRL